MLSLFCVLLVVAQPTVNANRAMTLIMLNEVRICFIFIGSIQFCGRPGDDFIARKEFTQELSQPSWGSVYKTLVQYVRVAAHLLPSSSLFENAISRSDRLVGSASHQTAEQFCEARLVRIAHGTLAIGLDPFGMLDSQIVVNLLLEFRVGVDLVIHGNWLG
jgi:hypothetical protein